ncbi:MAG: glycosyltransferase [Pseudomonadota bacterium]
MSSWRILVLCNDRATLAANLAASDDVRSRPDALVVEDNAPSAAIGINALLARTPERYAIVAHQDVYLPKGWIARLLSAISEIERDDPNWGVLGVYGVRTDGEHAGRVWSSGIGRVIGAPLAAPTPVGSLDELLLVVNQTAELRFDEDLPGFHLYGTDIVQSALRMGRRSYVIDAPVVHNSQPVRSLSGAYMAAYRHMCRKWRGELPIETAVATLRRPVFLQSLRNIRRSRAVRARLRDAPSADAARPDPALIARRLGFE